MCVHCAPQQSGIMRGAVHPKWFISIDSLETWRQRQEEQTERRDNSTAATYVVFQGDAAATITLHTASLSLTEQESLLSPLLFLMAQRLALNTASVVFHFWKPNVTSDCGDSCREVPLKTFLWPASRAMSRQQNTLV